jgi:hypothetical protein
MKRRRRISDRSNTAKKTMSYPRLRPTAETNRSSFRNLIIPVFQTPEATLVYLP